MVDFSEDLQPVVELEIQRLKKEENMGEWILFIDETSNFRGTCLGIILKSPQGEILPQAVSFEFDAINNEAEYEH